LPSKALSLHWMNEDPANKSFNKLQQKNAFTKTREDLFKLIKKLLLEIN
jgi:hypothetical protein